MDRRERRVLLGRVVGVHGVRGGVKVDSFTEPRDRILEYQPWILRRNGVETIVRAKSLVRHGKVVAAIEGIEDRDAAAALLGSEICVRRVQLPAPTAGEYYWIDLEGLAVVNLDGVALGHIDSVFATAANDVLVVHDGERERLIPFAKDAVVKRVDIQGGKLLVDWDADF